MVQATNKAKVVKFYHEDVIFIDPTQKTIGLDSYIQAQEKLIKDVMTFL